LSGRAKPSKDIDKKTLEAELEKDYDDDVDVEFMLSEYVMAWHGFTKIHSLLLVALMLFQNYFLISYLNFVFVE
jgi:hypothetical protein